MKHNMTISVSKKPASEGVFAYKTLTVRERMLRFLLGVPCKMTILIPGDTVDEVSIREVMEV